MAEPARRWVAPLVAGIAVTAVGLVFVLPYLAEELRFPLGWDSPFYVWRTAAVGVDGLDRIGGVRPATPLLFNALAGLTGNDAFTVAAIGPALLAAVAGLAAAGLLRAAYDIGPGWIPPMAVLAWIGFGHPGMVREQPDNVLNAALTLGAMAAAVAHVRWGGGWWAVTVLLAGAGLAHWPFFVLGAAVLVLGAAAFAGRRLVAARGEDEERDRARGLIGAAAAAAGAVGGALLWRPASAWTTPQLEALKDVLKDRFLRRAGDPHRLPVLPLAGAGLAVASRRRDRPERRLFLFLMLAWIGLTAVGAALQAAGVPTAGVRLLNYLFPLTLLTGVLVWWIGTRLGTRGAMAAAGLALAGFGALAIPFQLDGRTWYEPAAVRQIASAGAWLEANAPGTLVAFTVAEDGDVLTRERRRNTILAALPPGVARYTSVSDTAQGHIFVAVRAYDPDGHDFLLRIGGREIAPGVAAGGDLGSAPARALVEGPSARTDARTVALVVVLGGAALFAAGLGWAMTLLPEDRLLRWTLAPALGAAAASVIGVAWAATGLTLDGVAGAGPLALSALAGGGLARWRRREA